MSVKGIDVSYWQDGIDWKKVKADGVQFAVLREGYRNVLDKRFIENVKGCIENGISVMVYHFIYTDNCTTIENAKSTVQNMKAAGLDVSKTWIFADLEYDTWKKNKEKCTREKCSLYTLEYIKELEKLGCKKIGVYMNCDYYKNYYADDIKKNHKVWLADYSGEPDFSCSIHQYSDAGKVNGINGNVDMDTLYDTEMLSDSKDAGGNTMTENELRNKPVAWLKQFEGIREGSAEHKQILKVYNDSKLCTRYTMTTKDSWCATAVSAAFIANGLAGKAGSGKLFECVECSCENMIELAKKQGIWQESDAYSPKVGDVVLYDWDDNGVGDCTGWSDHVGLVSKAGNPFTVVEGNYSDTVKERTIAVNARYIRGFITPDYAKFATSSSKNNNTSASGKSIEELAQAVIRGKYGTGNARKAALGSKYAAVQNRVNELLKANNTTSAAEIDRLARAVIRGEYGTGEARKAALGSKYAAVQKRVNELLK